MKKYLSLTLLLIFVINACTKITETNIEPKQEPKPYMTLQIGDLRQYYLTGENTFAELEIVDTVKRSDSLKVYEMKNSFMLPDGVYYGMSYGFIRDGYFWTTSLDTVKQPCINLENPFVEEKIINIYPINEEYFLRTGGVFESERTYHKLTVLDSFVTPFITYAKIQQCEIIGLDTVRNIRLYYAPNFGHVATLITNSAGPSLAYVTYLKVGEIEIGTQISFFSKKIIEGIPDKYKSYKFISNY